MDPAHQPAASDGAGRPAPASTASGGPPRPPRRSSAPAARRQPSQRTTVVVLSVLSVVVVVVAIAAFVIGSGSDGPRTPAATVPPGASTTLATVPASDLRPFRDDEAGFSLQLPRQWQEISVPRRDVRLLMSAGGGDSMQVRVVEIAQPVTRENLDNIKAVTDDIVKSNAANTVLTERKIDVNGLPGYYYLYTFKDAASGTEGAHAHYFLFQGRKMNILVFQALPSEGFNRLAGIFDQVVDSFRSDPTPLPATTSPPPTAPPPS